MMELYYLRRVIKRKRKQLGLSQMELSFRAGLSKNVVANIETGKHTPTLPTVLKLLKAMNLDIRIVEKDG